MTDRAGPGPESGSGGFKPDLWLCCLYFIDFQYVLIIFFASFPVFRPRGGIQYRITEKRSVFPGPERVDPAARKRLRTALFPG